MADDKPSGEYEFKLPDFDEDTFIHREMVSFKTTSILFVWGIVAAALSWAVFRAVHGNTASGWLLGLVVCIAGFLALKPLFLKFGADIGHFKRREWTGTAFLFFFTWLAFFMVAINPPLSDFAPPQALATADPPSQVVGGNVSLAFLAVDNDHVVGRSLTITRDQDAPLSPAPTAQKGDLVYYNLTGLQRGHYVVAVTASDPHGLSTTSYANFTVEGVDFTVQHPRDLDATSLVVAHLPGHESCTQAYKAGCVRTVYAQLSTGTVIAMDPPASDRPGDWTLGYNFKGWQRGNNTFTVHAEFLNHYLGAHSIPGGRIDLPDTYTVNVTVEPGTHTANVPPLQASRALNVPHLEVPALLAVLLGLAALLRRR